MHKTDPASGVHQYQHQNNWIKFDYYIYVLLSQFINRQIRDVSCFAFRHLLSHFF